MSAAAAIASGIRRVNRAAAIVLSMWALTFAIGIPLALTVREAIDRQLGPSLEAAQVTTGASYDWVAEFGANSSGVATTFGPSVVGFAAVLDNAGAFIDNVSRPAVITATALAYVLLWTFLAGGIIDRYARGDAGFFKACGIHFPGLFRLGLLSALVYGVLFGSLHPWLLDDLYARLIRDLNAERTAFLIRLALYLVFLLVLGTFSLLFDFAKVRLVTEQRYSAVGALRGAARFALRRPADAVAVYLGNLGLFVLVLAVYALVAPGAKASGWSMWVGVAVSQAYVAARIWVKLVFWSSEVALFQGPVARSKLSTPRGSLAN